jgi:sirohydrochlorin cobaltochelatase
VEGNLTDAALLLIAHGSTVNRESAAPTYQHAGELRRRGLFGAVFEAFWKQEPGIRTVLAGVVQARVFAVPLFISEGYFTRQVIPHELGLENAESGTLPLVQRGPDRALYYCAPIGTHASMADVILSRAREVVEKHPFPRAPKTNDTALVIAGHGTDRNDNSRRAVEEQVARIREQGLYREVHAVFMEESPRIQECYGLIDAKNMVVVPFFMSDGLHSYEDIPVMLGEAEAIVHQRLLKGQPTWRNPTEKKGKLVWYARSVGTEPHVADVVLNRVREALAAPGP